MPPRPVGRVRRRSAGVSLGSLPVSNVVTIEVGLAIALLVLTIVGVKTSAGALNVVSVSIAGAVLLIALILAFTRSRGRWLTQWIGVRLRYNFRSHGRTAKRDSQQESKLGDDEMQVLGPEDPRVALLRLAIPDLVVAKGVDH